MAVFSATDVSVSFNAVDLSDHCTSVTFETGANTNPTTNFGSGGWEESIMGLKNGSVQFNFNQDFAASSVDATVWNAYATGTNVEVILKPTSGSVSATNPSYTFDVVPAATQPINANIGDLATQSLTFPISGAVARATS